MSRRVDQSANFFFVPSWIFKAGRVHFDTWIPRAVQCFALFCLHAQIVVHAGNVHTWQTTVILFDYGKNLKTPKFSPMPRLRWRWLWDLWCISVTDTVLFYNLGFLAFSINTVIFYWYYSLFIIIVQHSYTHWHCWWYMYVHGAGLFHSQKHSLAKQKLCAFASAYIHTMLVTLALRLKCWTILVLYFIFQNKHSAMLSPVTVLYIA